MTGADEPQRAAWQTFPEDMPVTSMPKVFAVNTGADGQVWIWVRLPNAVVALDFEPDKAELLAKGLIEAAARGYQIRDSRDLDVIRNPLLGPNGQAL